MERVSLEDGLQLVELSPDFYQSAQRPWTWPGTRIIPGGILMALAAAASYQTLSSDFALDALQAHFLQGPTPDQPLYLKVERLSDGGRFSTRVVIVEQASRAMVHVICSFVRIGTLRGPNMEHSTQRATNQTIEKITLDDLEPGGSSLGPYMKFQRLPLTYNGLGQKPSNPPPQSLIYTSVAQISPPISTENQQVHALGVIALSDYNILDAPPTLHGLTFGLPLIDDESRTRTYNHLERYTTLNHTVHFHVHGGFRADELCYIEVASPWAGQRRAEAQSRIFDRLGKLVATCVQEAYYVLKDEKSRSKI